MNPTIKELGTGSFIFECEEALPAFLCEDMVKRFEARTDAHYAGRVGSQQRENQQLKKTTDLAVTGKPEWQDVQNNLFRSLALSLQAFSEAYPYFAELKRFQDTGYNLQRYQAGEYYHWHVDADNPALAARQLVALWYLNEVAQGGTTDFYHQGIRVTPKTGKLILFPPFWTHQHRAATVEKGVKYIATTWVTFRDKPERA